MNTVQALILGIIEGLTEFLPVSSTGHMILAGKLLAIPQGEFVKSFEIIVQFGAILAVILYSAKTLLDKKEALRKIIAAFIPTGILGFILYKAIKHYLLGNTSITAIALIIGGIVFIMLEKILQKKTKTTTDISKITYKQAIGIGIIQSFSMIPGVSRAAASIFGGMSFGLDRETAVLFSFLLAIPTMAAATGFDIFKSGLSFSQQEYAMLLLGLSTACITAFFSITFLMKYIRTHSFIPFGIYRIIVGILFLFFL